MADRIVTDADLAGLDARQAALTQAWFAELPLATEPDPDPDPLDRHPADVTATAKAGAIVLGWGDPPAGVPLSYAYERDGKDVDGSGPGWSGQLAASVHTAELDKLTPGQAYEVAVTAVWPDGTYGVSLRVSVPADPIPPVTPPGTTGSVTWPSGAFTVNDAAQLTAMGAWRGRPMTVGAAFTSRESPAALESMWWLEEQHMPKGLPVAIGIPMALAGGLGQDLSSSMAKIAAAMKADGRLFWIRLGWEMNLPQWAWHVNDSNLAQWRSRWSQYYAIFKKALGDKGQVGFNPNVGGNQSGLSGSILRAWVDGQVDWCGPDAYDCWPAFTSDAAVAEQLTRDQGLNWWAKTAVAKGVPLCLPECGVSSGAQWAGHQGGDNPRYVTEISKWLLAANKQGKGVGFDAWFNEPASYVASAIYPPNLNPRAGAQYKTLWSAA